MNPRFKQLLWLAGIIVISLLLWWGMRAARNFRSAAVPPPTPQVPKLEELTSVFDLPLFQSLMPEALSVTSTPPLGRGNPFQPVSP